MKRTIETKFFTFRQNNSGGYFVTNDEHGVCEYVIIEAQTPEEAWSRLQAIGGNVPGFNQYCGCCGERWSSWMEEDDANEIPKIYDTPVEEVKKDFFKERCFIHYYDATMKEIVFPA